MPLHEQTWGCITKTGSRMKRLEARPKTMGIIGSDRSHTSYNILTASSRDTQTDGCIIMKIANHMTVSAFVIEFYLHNSPKMMCCASSLEVVVFGAVAKW